MDFFESQLIFNEKNFKSLSSARFVTWMIFWHFGPAHLEEKFITGLLDNIAITMELPHHTSINFLELHFEIINNKIELP